MESPAESESSEGLDLPCEPHVIPLGICLPDKKEERPFFIWEIKSVTVGTCKIEDLVDNAPRKWIGSGDPPGLQNQWDAAFRQGSVGSIPTHFRHLNQTPSSIIQIPNKEQGSNFKQAKPLRLWEGPR